MNNTFKGIVALAALIIVIAAIYIFLPKGPVQTPPTSDAIATATYACSAGKSITASYYEGASAPQTNADEPPTPNGSVVLALSDGRSMTLAQTISADGARYANADESTVFWNKGRGLTFTENGQQTYMGCIEVAKDPGGLTQVYENGTEGFSIRLPNGYATDENYTYQNLGPGKEIGGVKFAISPAVSSGTNLSSDSYVSVEEMPQAASCTADMFLGAGATAKEVTDDDTTYSVASASDAAAGNRYEETVYAIPGTNPCIAVRYFIHYGVFENYPAGSIKEFDSAALTAQFDAIRRTLITL